MAGDDESFQLFSSLRYDPLLRDVPPAGSGAAGWNFQGASALYMLDYHRDRMLRAAAHWGWDSAAAAIGGPAGLRALEAFISGSLRGSDDGPRRVKVTLAQGGRLGCDVSRAPATSLANLFPAQLPPPGADDGGDVASVPAREPLYEVVVDGGRTARSELTHFKTTARAMYDAARLRAAIGLADRKEVLVVHEGDDLVMEGSFTTPYFWRGGRWVTPPVSPTYSPRSGSGGQDGTTRRWALERQLAVEEEVSVGSLVDGEECWLSNGVKGFFCGKISLVP